MLLALLLTIVAIPVPTLPTKPDFSIEIDDQHFRSSALRTPPMSFVLEYCGKQRKWKFVLLMLRSTQSP